MFEDLTPRGKIVAGVAAGALALGAAGIVYEVNQNILAEQEQQRLFSTYHLAELADPELAAKEGKSVTVKFEQPVVGYNPKAGDTPTSIAQAFGAKDVRLVAYEISHQVGGGGDLEIGEKIILPTEQLDPERIGLEVNTLEDLKTIDDPIIYVSPVNTAG